MSASTATATTAREASGLNVRGAKPGLVLAVVLLATFVINLDTTIVNVALPALSRELHATTSGLQWSSMPTAWRSPGWS
jgi:MFS family permease